MISVFSIQFWIGVQLIVDFIFVLLLFGIIRQVNKHGESRINNDCFDNKSHILRDKTTKAANEIMEILEPLVHESETAAKIFDRQIKEKKIIMQKLNDALDARIISINLLLSRAETQFEKLHRENFSAMKTYPDFNSNPDFNSKNSFQHSQDDVIDQQKKILELYAMGSSVESIASELAMPEGEVNLVINLKEKFIKMESQV